MNFFHHQRTNSMSTNSMSTNSMIVNPYMNPSSTTKRTATTPTSATTTPSFLSSSASISLFTNRNRNQKSIQQQHHDSKTNYQFIGGAEAARRNAIQQHAKSQRPTLQHRHPPTRIVRPGEDVPSSLKTTSSSNSNNSNSNHNHKRSNVLSKYMNTFERFFAALLRSTVPDYIAASGPSLSATQQSLRLWEEICQRLDLPIWLPPHQPIQSQYTDLTTHCNVRAALIVEEARNTIAEAISKLYQQQQQHVSSQPKDATTNRYQSSYKKKNPIRLTVQVQKVEPCSNNNNNNNKRSQNNNSHEHFKVTFKSPEAFTNAELLTIRPGAIFVATTGHQKNRLPPTQQQRTTTQQTPVSVTTLLGVVTTGNRDFVESNRSFVMIFFRYDDMVHILQPQQPPPSTAVSLTYVTQLVTELRCYEALTTNYTIHFVSHLLGNPNPPIVTSTTPPTHIRFQDPSSTGKSFSQESSTSTSKNGLGDNDIPSTNLLLLPSTQVPPLDHLKINDYFHIPTLNQAQDDAADTFLTSSPNTITLVQGPPGTGKTTLLVSIICRYLMDSVAYNTTNTTKHQGVTNGSDDTINMYKCNRRLMVSAPTNKAVSVLATRFMKAIRADSSISFNVIMVGDADKLFHDERGGGGSSSSGGSKWNKNGPTTRKPPVQQQRRDQQQLKSIFLYTWMPNIVEGYTRILTYFLPKYTGTDTIPILYQLAVQLRQRLMSCLMYLPDTLVAGMNKIVKGLKSMMKTLSSSSSAIPIQHSTIATDTKKHIKELSGMALDAVWEQVRFFKLLVPYIWSGFSTFVSLCCHYCTGGNNRPTDISFLQPFFC
jgi:AAA domain